jgi:hypothetical protein
VKNDGEEYTMRSFIVVFRKNINQVIKQTNMNFGTYGGEVKCVQESAGKSQKKETTLKM